jgi:hypothetical protein
VNWYTRSRNPGDVCQPPLRMTMVVIKRDGTTVLDPQVPGACVMSLDEDGATTLDTLLSVWLG